MISDMPPLPAVTLASPPVPRPYGWVCPNQFQCDQGKFRLGELEKKVEADRVLADEHAIERKNLEAALAGSASVTSLARERETVKRLQSIEMVMRKSVDRLVNENYALRQIMQTNKMDMGAVDAILDKLKAPKDAEDQA